MEKSPSLTQDLCYDAGSQVNTSETSCFLCFPFSFSFFFNRGSSQFGKNKALLTMHISVLFICQVDSVLGPLQLSLYKMLGNVWEFLLLFLVLHLSFATGLAKMYSYYVASQLELHRQNMTHYEEKHYFAR